MHILEITKSKAVRDYENYVIDEAYNSGNDESGDNKNLKEKSE